MRYGYLTIIMNEHSRAFMVRIMGERANLGLAYEVCNWRFNIVENGMI
jgi:hypothetical protein